MKLKYLVVLLCSLFVFACGSSEKEARTLLNEALLEVYQGKFAEAKVKFSLIEEKYYDTKAAKDAIKEKAEIYENSKATYKDEKLKRLGKGIITSKLLILLDNYNHANQSFPNELSQLKLGSLKKYQALCEYQTNEFHYGYQLDCSKAEEKFKSDRKNKKRSHKKKGKKNVIPTLADFPQANSSWGKEFNPSKDVPEQGFSAYYFNSNQPTKVISHEQVESISINYAWNDFHNIKSEDFAGYWVGRINIDKPQVMNIAISQSRAKTRLIIDGAVVFEGTSKKEIPIQFEKGEHIVEVEHINNWHTTEFAVTFLVHREKLSDSELKKRLVDSIKEEYEVYFAGVYESASRDLSTRLDIQQTEKPIVLFLSSYSAVKWFISNPYRVDIKAIIYGSHKPGVEVKGDLPDSALLLQAGGRIGSYNTERKCTCRAGHFHCEGSGMLNTKSRLERITGKVLTGFTGKYSASVLKVPQLIVDKPFLQAQEDNKRQIEQLRKECQQQSDPNFDDMFKK